MPNYYVAPDPTVPAPSNASMHNVTHPTKDTVMDAPTREERIERRLNKLKTSRVLSQKDVADLRFAIRMNLPSMQKLQRESDEVHLDDRVNKLENIIIRTIKNYDNLDVNKAYKASLSTSKTKHGSSTKDRAKLLDGASSPYQREEEYRASQRLIPFGYYGLGEF